ncbi:hypothetical protein BN11_1240001 [Nostocoides australiense Ben110]|uniref:Uncharacterized protein n=1 Tax=Nostocoides australiense Ben110 TaxID=1193182 RepID=W6JU48_9MICO|nr:hypothetical protein BN11_1240001 [Tetrasphaera australiensis Ben110]
MARGLPWGAVTAWEVKTLPPPSGWARTMRHKGIRSAVTAGCLERHSSEVACRAGEVQQLVAGGRGGWCQPT